MSRPELRFNGAVRRTNPVQIEIDGQTHLAYEGETIAAALLAAGKRVLHVTEVGSTRGIYCGIGLCNGCLVTVNGIPNVRACATRVEPGLKVETQQGPGWLEGVLDGDR